MKILFALPLYEKQMQKEEEEKKLTTKKKIVIMHGHYYGRETRVLISGRHCYRYTPEIDKHWRLSFGIIQPHKVDR